MVALSFEVYRCKERFYVFLYRGFAEPEYNDALVDQVPVDGDIHYETWLENMRQYFSRLQAVIEMRFKECAFHETMKGANVDHGLVLFSANTALSRLGVSNSPMPMDNSDKMDNFPLLTLPVNESISWTYCVDLDNEQMSVNHYYHFPLRHIPKNWKTIVHGVRPRKFSRRAFLPRYFPGENEPELGLISVTQAEAKFTSRDFRYSQEWKIVKAKPLERFVQGKQCAIRFARYLLHKMIRVSKAAHWDYVSASKVDAHVVRNSAFLVLCLAAGSPEHLKFARLAQPCIRLRDNDDIHFGLLRQSSGISDHTLSILHAFGVHLDSVEHQFAPDSDLFWFAGALVCLYDNINEPTHAESAVMHVLGVGLEEGRISFHAIIMSSSHVILLERLSNGMVKRTLPLTYINVDEIVSMTSTEPPDDPDGFVAIAHLLEASRVQRSRLNGYSSQYCRFPTEIIVLIIESIEDIQTLVAVSSSCKTFREICQARCSFDRYNIAFDQTRCYLQSRNQTSVFELKDDTKMVSKIKDSDSKSPIWVPVIGSTSLGRVILPDSAFQFSVPDSEVTQGVTYLGANA